MRRVLLGGLGIALGVFGGIAAAPLFRDIARFALARLRVPPAAKLPFPVHAISPS